MKRLALIFIIIFVSFSGLKAQTFIDGTTYFYSGSYSQDGKNYPTGWTSQISLDSIVNTTEFYSYNNDYIEVRNDSIFHKHDNQSQSLIFILNLSVSDSFRIKCTSGIVDSFTIRVDSIDQSTVNSKRRYHLSMIPPPWGRYKNFIWEEELGTYEQGIVYTDVCSFFEGSSRLSAICRNDTPRYPTGEIRIIEGDSGCDFKESLRKLSIDKLNSKDNYRIYPNPSNGLIEVRSQFSEGSGQKSETRLEKIEVFDMQGIIVNFTTKDPLTFNSLTLNCPSGVYYLKLYRDDGLFEVHKIVIE